MTWEEAILWLRAQDDQQELVRLCYYDDPLEAAAARFAESEEWAATTQLLSTHLPGRVLEIGAGRGIVSHAFARLGCLVTALEPDAGEVVGRGAIEHLCRRTGVIIDSAAGHGEALPFANGSFDVVYGRAVLHHARDLRLFCAEAARVLRPGGVALFVREHVISRAEDLDAFRAAHPLHPQCGGEAAYPLAEFEMSLRRAGLRLGRVIGPLENAVNYFPMTQAEVRSIVTQRLGGNGRWGGRLARLLLCAPGCRRLLTRWISRRLDTPGRHFAFLGVKP